MSWGGSPFAPRSPKDVTPKPMIHAEAPTAIPQRLTEPPVFAPEQPLADQVGRNLSATLDPRGKAALAKSAGLTPNTIVRAISGTGLKLSTLESIARVLGWSIEVKDRDGTTIARLES